MKYGILGPFEVSEGGRPLVVSGGKQRALLAMLLLNANRVVSADRLVDALWEDDPPETAVKAVQVLVSQLRKLLGRGRLETQPPGYVLRVEEGELDLHSFQRLADEGSVSEALELWRGEPLAEFEGMRFAQSEISRLEELRLSCVEEQFERALADNRQTGLVGELERMVGEHPLRERLRGQLMLALYRSGRQAEALDSYQDGRRVLVDELGIEPGRALRELHQQILNQSSSLDVPVTAGSQIEPPGSPFVGRDRELADLRLALDDAFAGHGRLVLVVGEPGIGKSRLAEEMMSAARSRGARILVGRCWEAGGAPAYWPWVQSLRTYVREASAAELREQLPVAAADLVQILPELSDLLPPLPAEGATTDPASARFRLFDAVAELLRRASRDRPIVLVLDDLHAADTPSLLLLQYVARQLESSRLLILGAFRDVDPVPNGPLTAMLAEVAREPGTRRLSLRGLSHQDVADYVTETAVDLMRPELVRLLHDETEGNPLFVGEMVRLLVVEGTTDSLQIPQTVRDVIARRLAHLSDECNRVLVLASVMGREFEIDALARLAGVDEQALLETLDEAMTARVVSEVPGGSQWLRFAHVLIRDTLYDSVTSVRRVRLHRLAAKVLEELYGEESGPHLAELAHHAVAGSEFEKGLRYARVAADRALALLAYEEAGRLSTMALEALDLCDPDNEATRCQLLLSRGEAEIRAGDTPTGKQTFLDAAAIARQLGLAPELARAAFGYAGRIVWSRAGADHRVVPLLEEGLTALRDSDVELRVRLLARLAGALRDEHSRDRRDAISLEAVELARRCGSAAALAYALDARAHAITAPDTVAEILELGTELRELAGLIGDREKVVAGHMLRSMAQLWCGKVSEAVAEMATAGRIAEELRQPAQLWLVHTARAMLALARGEITQAEALAAEALLLGERAQPDAAIPHYWMHRYITADFRGVYDDVEHEIHALASDHPTRPVFRCVLGHLLARQRRYDEAGRILAELRPDRFAALPFDQEWLFGTSLLAETAALLGDVDAAQVLYDLIMPWARFDAVDVAEGTRGSMDRYLGLLATTLEAWDHATEHFEAALEANSRNRLRPWLAYTEYDYARMHLARDEEGDAERAAQLIGRALATFGELGMAAPIDLREQFA